MQRQNAPWEESLALLNLINRISIKKLLIAFCAAWERRMPGTKEEAFEVNWATCQQLADEGSQRDPTRIETPLNWPPERAGSSVEGTRLVQTQKTICRQVVKARADKRARPSSGLNLV